jgi:hypothetical protein
MLSAAPSSSGLSTFAVDDFVKSLSGVSSPVPFAGGTSHGRHRARDEFYGRLCRSANFGAWTEGMSLAERQSAVGMLNGD